MCEAGGVCGAQKSNPGIAVSIEQASSVRVRHYANQNNRKKQDVILGENAVTEVPSIHVTVDWDIDGINH